LVEYVQKEGVWAFLAGAKGRFQAFPEGQRAKKWVCNDFVTI
jgi:hypothetical protein